MARYRHEEVAQSPPGWRVRTVTQGAHRIRVACGSGGACRTVSILHPAGEKNPCNMRYLLRNPSELLIMGANPHRARPNPSTIGARIAQMKASGASGAEVGRMLSKATANPHRRGREGRRGNPSDAGDVHQTEIQRMPTKKLYRLYRAAQKGRALKGMLLLRPSSVAQMAEAELQRRGARRNSDLGGGDSEHGYQCFTCGDLYARKSSVKPCPTCGEPVCRKCRGKEHPPRHNGQNPRPYRKLVRSDAQTTASGGIRRSLISAHATRIAAEDAAEKLKGPGLVAERWKTGFDYTPAEITELRARPWGVWRVYQNPEFAKHGVRFEKLPDGRARIVDRATGQVLKTYKQYAGPHARRIIAQDIRRFSHMLAELEAQERGITTPISPLRQNPSGAAVDAAADLYTEFHGRGPKEILELEEPERKGVVLTGLGELIALTVDPAGAKQNGNGNGRHKWIELDFAGEGIKLASSADGKQLHLVGGNQSLPLGDLSRFGSDTSKDLIPLGKLVGPESIVYRSSKSFTGHKPANWKHEFAEEGGQPPIAVYDKPRRRIVLVGGSYRVEAPGIIN